MKKFFVLCILCLFAISASAHEEVTVGLLLDETGSMNGVRQETVDGVNNYIEKLQTQDKNIRFTLITFNTVENKSLYIDRDIKRVKKLSPEDYDPNHMTNLYDSIATFIEKIEDKRPSLKTKTLCVIYTDGLENSSKEHDKNDILRLIEKKEGENWTFVYLGSNQDAWAESEKISIPQGNTFDYDGWKIKDVWVNLTNCSSGFISSDAMVTDNFFNKEE